VTQARHGDIGPPFLTGLIFFAERNSSNSKLSPAVLRYRYVRQSIFFHPEASTKSSNRSGTGQVLFRMFGKTALSSGLTGCPFFT